MFLNQSNYPTRFFMPLAIIGSFLMLLYNEDMHWDIFSNPSFYLAWLISAAIVLVLIYFIYRLTVWLDHKHPWYKHYNRRLKFQVLGGIVLPACIAFGLVSLYFAYYEINVFRTIWLKTYFVQTLFLLVIFNLLFLYFLHRNWSKIIQDTRKRNPAYTADFTDWTEIACVFAFNKKCYRISLNGAYEFWKLNMQDSLDALPEALFFQINRSLIVNFASVDKVMELSAKNNYVVLPEQVLRTLYRIRNGTHLEESEYKRFVPYLKVSYTKRILFKQFMEDSTKK